MSSFSVVLGNGGVVGVVVGTLVSSYLKGLSVKDQQRRTLLSQRTEHEIVTYSIDQGRSVGKMSQINGLGFRVLNQTID